MIAPDGGAGKGLLETLGRQRDTARYGGRGERVNSAPQSGRCDTFDRGNHEFVK